MSGMLADGLVICWLCRQAEGQSQRGESRSVASQKAGGEGIVLAAGRSSGRVGSLFGCPQGIENVGRIPHFKGHDVTHSISMSWWTVVSR
jgi:hypothetical protein